MCIEDFMLDLHLSSGELLIYSYLFSKGGKHSMPSGGWRCGAGNEATQRRLVNRLVEKCLVKKHEGKERAEYECIHEGGASKVRHRPRLVKEEDLDF